MFLFPSDVLRPRRVDDHFAQEAEAARELGMPCALVDHNALTSGDAARGVARVPPGEAVVYRGWMLSAAEWTTGPDREEFDAARRRLGDGPAVLRDYTKSMKHYWDEAVYIPSLADGAAAWRVASRFLELRDEDFTGGFVLRRFEAFTGGEVRTWWRDGVCRLAGAHPDTPDVAPPADLSEVTPLVEALALPFVTVDLVQHEDGRWRVVELGDGQVSDRPASMPAAGLVAAITG